MAHIGPTAVKTLEEPYFDLQYGDGIREQYQGDRDAIMSLYQAFRAIGWRCTTGSEGDFVTLDVFSPTASGSSSSTTEIPTVKWELRWEMVQVSIWNAPVVATEMLSYPTGVATKNPAQYRKYLEDAKKNGAEFPTELNAYSVAAMVYREICRGAEAYEVKRPTLQRVRTYSASYASRFSIDATEKVYSTTLLGTTFSVPNAILALLPSTGDATPTQTQWGWRLRDNTQVFTVAINKVEETTDWVFAAWSTLLYTYIG